MSDDPGFRKEERSTVEVQTCSWSNAMRGPKCKAPVTHVVNFNRIDHPLCEEHARPELHPPDLRERIRLIGSGG